MTYSLVDRVSISLADVSACIRDQACLAPTEIGSAAAVFPDTAQTWGLVYFINSIGDQKKQDILRGRKTNVLVP